MQNRVDVVGTVLRGTTVLCVDDDEAWLDLMTHYLRSGGAEVVAVSRPEEALTALVDGGIDVLVSDIRMPGMSGLQLLQQVFSTLGYGEIPAIAVSGDRSFGHVAERSGFSLFLQKPLDRDTLVDAVRSVLDVWKFCAAEQAFESESRNGEDLPT